LFGKVFNRDNGVIHIRSKNCLIRFGGTFLFKAGRQSTRQFSRGLISQQRRRTPGQFWKKSSGLSANKSVDDIFPYRWK